MSPAHRAAIDDELGELGRLVGSMQAVAPAAASQFVPALAELQRECRRARVAYHAELRLERFAQFLRQRWLQYAAMGPSQVYRSPTESEQARLEAMPLFENFGYERDLQPEALERRCATFFPAPPAGWTVDHLLFSSGQAAMLSALLSLQNFAAGMKLRVRHVGAYYETRALLAVLPTSVELVSGEGLLGADCLVVEPVSCNGSFMCSAVPALAASAMSAAPPRAFIFDTTLLGRSPFINDFLDAAELPASTLVLGVCSGLKLFQAGLELANVGILSRYQRRRGVTAKVTHAQLQELRTLTGGGIRLADAVALRAPWVFDASATEAYEQAIFAGNASLARHVAGRGALFEPVTHPTFDRMQAPYCVFRLRRPSVAAYAHLEDRIARESARRRILLDHGGSFGFRGHRYEVVRPGDDESPFLRIAMGCRRGWSFDGVLSVLADLAETETLA